MYPVLKIVPSERISDHSHFRATSGCEIKAQPQVPLRSDHLGNWHPRQLPSPSIYIFVSFCPTLDMVGHHLSLWPLSDGISLLRWDYKGLQLPSGALSSWVTHSGGSHIISWAALWRGSSGKELSLLQVKWTSHGLYNYEGIKIRIGTQLFLSPEPVFSNHSNVYCFHFLFTIPESGIGALPQCSQMTPIELCISSLTPCPYYTVFWFSV